MKKNNINIQELVQEKIREYYDGIQTIGSAMYVYTDYINLIHTPTMKTPGKIIDLNAIYFATRNAIICAREHYAKKIIMPAFGGGVGNVNPIIIARIMADAISSLEFNYFENWEAVSYLTTTELV